MWSTYQHYGVFRSTRKMVHCLISKSVPSLFIEWINIRVLKIENSKSHIVSHKCNVGKRAKINDFFWNNASNPTPIVQLTLQFSPGLFNGGRTLVLVLCGKMSNAPKFYWNTSVMYTYNGKMHAMTASYVSKIKFASTCSWIVKVKIHKQINVSTDRIGSWTSI